MSKRNTKGSAESRLLTDGVKVDSPIRFPEDDLLGVNPFAKTIAQGIVSSDATDGLVYAINGAWGSGKSSVINLVLHHISETSVAERINVTAFNPWWFSGGEALTVAFFQEMRVTVGKSLDVKAREAMASLGGRLSSAGPFLGSIAAVFGTPAAGAAVAGGAALVEKITHFDTTVEKEYKRLYSALSKLKKRFVIVIDDIDRLDTNDALQIFKLIKSVGRLPNVIYLMAFDRKLAEKMVAERFPAEGVSFLEKVIQGGFDLPPPDPDDLRNQLLAQISATMGAPSEAKMTRFWNIFYDAVAPLLKTPRDVVRLSNSVKVSWTAIADNVDRADFLAIESLRLFLPSVYEAIRDNPSMLTGMNERGASNQSLETLYDQTFLGNLSGRDRQIAKRCLQRLFPRVNGIWDRVSYSKDSKWQRDRLICSSNHFRTYFVFGVPADLITAAESDALIAASKTPGATARLLSAYREMPRQKGGTRAAFALEELSLRSDDIAEQNVQQFLTDLFSVADEIDVSVDAAQGFALASNQLRIHWLLNNLLLNRFDIKFRSAVIKHAGTSASLNWIVSLSDRLKRKANSDEQLSEGDHEENMVDDGCADWLYNLSLASIRNAARGNLLVYHPDLIGLLFRWRDRVDEVEVRNWTDEQLDHDDFVVAIAKNSIREYWSHGMGGFGFLGDRVSRRSQYVHLKPLEPLLDIARFRARVATIQTTENISREDRDTLEKFQQTPERDPSL